MAVRLAEITAHIDNVRQLRSVVTAMRGIAASRVQQSRGLLAGIEAYAQVAARAIGEAQRFAPRDFEMPAPRPAPKALILFCAEGGFCGGLSDRVLDAAQPVIEGNRIFQIGTRGATLADERDIHLDWTTTMATQIGAVSEVAARIAAELYAGLAAGAFSRADVVYPRPRGAGGIAVEQMSLLPLDIRRFVPAEEAQPPLTNLPWGALLEQLAEEYVYAQLCSAAMHSFVAENEARMTAMAAAREHIDDTLKDLVLREHQARQEEITSEIVELSASTLRNRTSKPAGRP